jgi:hypothetical protein
LRSFVPFGQPASDSSTSAANSPMAQQRRGSWGLLDACRVSFWSDIACLFRPVLIWHAVAHHLCWLLHVAYKVQTCSWLCVHAGANANCSCQAAASRLL